MLVSVDCGGLAAISDAPERSKVFFGSESSKLLRGTVGCYTVEQLTSGFVCKIGQLSGDVRRL